MRSILGVALLASALSASTVFAQRVARAADPPKQTAAQPQLPATNPPTAAPHPGSARSGADPRIGYAADPPPPAQPVYVTPPVYSVYSQGGYYNYGYSQNGYVVTLPTYLVLTDGSVAVNFGNGYERVLRPCAPPQTSYDQIGWGRDALGRIPEPPGIAAMRAGTRGAAYGSAPASNLAACYRSDAQGRVEVVTPGR